MSIYTENGYENRMDYLKSLADEYDLSLDCVWMMASVLGKSEDFDGLVSEVQDESNRAKRGEF